MLNVGNSEGVQLQSKLFRGWRPGAPEHFTGAAQRSHDCVRNCGRYLYEVNPILQPSALPPRMRSGCC